MENALSDSLATLRQYPLLAKDQQAAWRSRVQSSTLIWPAEARELLESLSREESAFDATLDAPLAVLLGLLRTPQGAPARPWDAPLLDAATDVMSRLAQTPQARFALLHALVQSDDPAALGRWATLLERLLPIGAKEVDASLAPLFQRRTYDPSAIFPALLESLRHPSLATGVLDLANYLYRSGRCGRHPAAERVEQIAQLLGAVAQRLQQLDEAPASDGAEHAKALEVYQTSVALVIALCDALALIGNPSVVGKLNQVLELRHRRLRAEAACALARLGDKHGVEQLVALTREPVVRSRALAYLDEVGALDQAPPEARTSAARGEGDLAAWLAAPEQFGIAPQRMELIESRRQYWPGFDEQVDCHLFRFEYALPQGEFSGVGLAGPTAHALGVDLLDYPPGDIFATYCGWQAEHAELSETDARDVTAGERATADRYARRLVEEGYHDVRLVKVAHFFGDQHFVFEADRGDAEQPQPGVVVVDGGEPYWYPQPRASNPPGERELYWLHRGRKLLAYFNASK